MVDVTTAQPLSDAAALQGLRDQGRIEISIADVARTWGWTRPSTYRRLSKWADEGRIIKTGATGGRWVLSAVTDNPDTEHHQDLVAEPSGGVQPGVQAVRTRPDRLIVLPAVLLVTAFGLGVTGAALNARFAASFGQSPDAAVGLGAIGVAVDVLAMTLPATAARLWNRGRWASSLVAWVMWLPMLAMTVIAATGFAAGNLGDGIAGRARTAEAVVDLRRDLDRLRQERAGITEQRSVAEIGAAIARTRVADWAWRDTRQCIAAVSAEARKACDAVLHLRQAKAMAQRRDAVDDEVRAIEARLSALPSVGAADPTSFAAELVAWLTRGTVAPSERDIYRLRIAGLVVAPSLAGVILMFATALWQPKSSSRSRDEAVS